MAPASNSNARRSKHSASVKASSPTPSAVSSLSTATAAASLSDKGKQRATEEPFEFVYPNLNPSIDGPFVTADWIAQKLYLHEPIAEKISYQEHMSRLSPMLDELHKFQRDYWTAACIVNEFFAKWTLQLWRHWCQYDMPTTSYSMALSLLLGVASTAKAPVLPLVAFLRHRPSPSLLDMQTDVLHHYGPTPFAGLDEYDAARRQGTINQVCKMVTTLSVLEGTDTIPIKVREDLVEWTRSWHLQAGEGTVFKRDTGNTYHMLSGDAAGELEAQRCEGLWAKGYANCALPECQLNDGSRLKRCNRCHLACYCSEQHQRKHWKTHKTICFPLSFDLNDIQLS